MSTVTDNASIHVDSDVTRNAEGPGCTQCDRLDKLGLPLSRRFGERPHCSTCHADTHLACVECGACMGKKFNGYYTRYYHRLDRRYCSPTCRQKAYQYRQTPEVQARIAADKAYWESPEGRARVTSLKQVMGDDELPDDSLIAEINAQEVASLVAQGIPANVATAIGQKKLADYGEYAAKKRSQRAARDLRRQAREAAGACGF